MTLMPAFRWRHVRNMFQAVVLLSIGLIVVGALWVREVRTAKASGETDWRLERRPLSADYGWKLTRAGYDALGLDIPLKDPPNVGNRDRVMTALPTGSSYDVVVRGGFVAQRKDRFRGSTSPTYLAYAFEMAYRRHIESNDGCRIVERRSFGPIRMAKIVSPADAMRVRLSTPGELILSGVSFPQPGAGMTTAVLSAVAEGMLDSGIDSVLACDASRAWVETDALSEKTVRLTFVDGVGVESVEGVECNLTPSQLYLLFRQPILPEAIQFDQGERKCPEIVIGSRQLIPFCDPTKLPVGDVMLLEPFETSDGHRGSQILRTGFAVDEETNTQPPLKRLRTSATPMGELHYERTGTFVVDASLNWKLTEVAIPAECLLFESPFRDFEAVPTIAVRYQCRQRQDGISTNAD